MTTKQALVATMFIVWGVYTLVRQRQTINELIELNHDKSVYIDNGCKGRFQGTEEFLSNEARP